MSFSCVFQMDSKRSVELFEYKIKHQIKFLWLLNDGKGVNIFDCSRGCIVFIRNFVANLFNTKYSTR
jgi:hypothetical protein